MSDLVNLNTASQDELCSLPGVGTALAERIITHRPYALIAELQNVSGIGAALFARLEPLVTIDDKLENEVVATLDQEPVIVDNEKLDDMEDANILDEIPVSEARVLPPLPESPPKEKSTVTRRQAVLYSMGCSVGAIVISLVLMVVIFAGINGGLRFAHPSQVTSLAVQIEAVEIQIDKLTVEIEDLQDSLADLEMDEERINQVEQEIAEVVHVSEALIKEMHTIRDEANRFESFMDGLREILNTIFESETP